MDSEYHSEWHRIWAEEQAKRAAYKKKNLGLRAAVGPFIGGVRISKWDPYHWRKAVQNGETCAECGEKPPRFKGKPLF